MTKTQVMDIAMDLGKILLKSGAETSRVEDTMRKPCRKKPGLPGPLAFYGPGPHYGYQ